MTFNAKGTTPTWTLAPSQVTTDLYCVAIGSGNSTRAVAAGSSATMILTRDGGTKAHNVV